jgi:hypothetical protein
MILILIGSVSFSEVNFKTDKPVYKLGEEVTFILENGDDKPMQWASISMWPVIYLLLSDGERKVVREQRAILFWAIGSVGPGGRKEWRWDQRDYYQSYDRLGSKAPSRQVPPGNYIAEFPTITHGALQVKFRIQGPAALSSKARLAVIWGEVKRHLQRSEY